MDGAAQFFPPESAQAFGDIAPELFGRKPPAAMIVFVREAVRGVEEQRDLWSGGRRRRCWTRKLFAKEGQRTFLNGTCCADGEIVRRVVQPEMQVASEGRDRIIVALKEVQNEGVALPFPKALGYRARGPEEEGQLWEWKQSCFLAFSAKTFGVLENPAKDKERVLPSISVASILQGDIPSPPHAKDFGLRMRTHLRCQSPHLLISSILRMGASARLRVSSSRRTCGSRFKRQSWSFSMVLSFM